jgi:hypothetical protein
MSADWEAAIEAIADPRDRRAVRALLDVGQHHLGDFARERGPRPQGLAPDQSRWEVLCEVAHEPDVVSYLVDAPDAESADRQIADRPEVERVNEVIRVGRAEP